MHDACRDDAAGPGRAVSPAAALKGRLALGAQRVPLRHAPGERDERGSSDD
jgi:hypothetical protein